MEQALIPPRSSSIVNPSLASSRSTSTVQADQSAADSSAQRRASSRNSSDRPHNPLHYLSGPAAADSTISNGSSRAVVGTRRASGGETWRDFLRESGQPSGNTSSRREARSDQLRRTRTNPMDNTNGLSRSRSHDHGSIPGRKRVTSAAAEDHQTRRREYGGLSPHASVAVPGSAAAPIDLTSTTLSDRPPPPINIQRQASNGSIVLPRWQPDQNVAQCPVCSTPFSIWYRRHHCRKCGRVVCANCSPHRITIPRQFIVHPPSFASPSPFAVFGAVTESGQTAPQASDPRGTPLSRTSSAALGGGEVVRVCNPCVPDPNFSPPPQIPANTQPPAASSIPQFALPSNAFSAAPPGVSTRLPPISDHPPVSLPQLSSTVLQGLPPGLASFLSANPGATAFTQRERNDYQSLQDTSQRMSWLQARSSSINPPPAGPSNAPPYQYTRYPGVTDPALARRHRWGSYPGHRPLDAPLPPTPPPPPPPPRRYIKEEDECPICGRELPAKGPAGEEAARERHIEECIRLFSLPSSSAPKPSAQRGIPVAAAAASTSISTQGSSVGATSSAIVSTSVDHEAVEAMDDSMIMMPPPTRPNQHRMLIYQATEKDCVGEDGERQECVICFEEFEEGDEMGRLDCLCKFHRVCFSLSLVELVWACSGF